MEDSPALEAQALDIQEVVKAPAVRMVEGRPVTFGMPVTHTGETVPASKRASVFAMWAMGYTMADIMKAEKLSRNTIKALILNDAHKDSSLTDTIRKNLAGQWYLTGTRALHSITSEKLKSSSAPQLAIVASIATEKARLCEGLSTGRMEIDLTDPDLDAQIAQKESELSAWRSGQLVNAQASESQPGALEVDTLSPSKKD